ncbi:MAG: HaeIII family restriction endonuclease [Candidatus Dojkabacteria bacterium]
MIGRQDYYKIILVSKKRVVDITAFKLYGTLGLGEKAFLLPSTVIEESLKFDIQLLSSQKFFSKLINY